MYNKTTHRMLVIGTIVIFSLLLLPPEIEELLKQNAIEHNISRQNREAPRSETLAQKASVPEATVVMPSKELSEEEKRINKLQEQLLKDFASKELSEEEKRINKLQEQLLKDFASRKLPEKAGYIKGYDVAMTGGLSSVTVDNTVNHSDVIVKLFYLEVAKKDKAVRVAFIPAHSKFTFEKVAQGTFDIRYQNLDTGRLAKSEVFTLDEIPTYNGTEYTTMSMTLYPVANGNMHTTTISPEEFE